MASFTRIQEQIAVAPFTKLVPLPKSAASKGRLARIQHAIQAKNEKKSGAPKVEKPYGHSTRFKELKQLSRNILVMGLSFQRAPVELREKLAISQDELPQAIEELLKLNHIAEAAVLSTCNRVEVYVVALSWHMGFKEVSEWMSRKSGVPEAELRNDYMFAHVGTDAVRHLFRVASGLESLVMGETQILGQVKDVRRVAQLGKVLGKMFQSAVETGKQVRSETNISKGAMSISAAAVELVAPKLDMRQSRIVIVGAGKMAKLLVKHLVSKRCTHLVMVNRTEESVTKIQEELQEQQVLIEYRALADLKESCREADVIFTCTSSQNPLVLKEHLDQGSLCRYIIDIATPRNVEDRVQEVPGVVVYNVDDLREVVACNTDERRQEASRAQVIIEEQVREVEDWINSLDAVETIKKLRLYAESVRLGTMHKACLQLRDDEHAKGVADEFSKKLVNKLLDGPTRHLRLSGENKQAVELMFQLQEEQDEGSS